MGAVAGPNITLLMLTAMEHDLTFRISMRQNARMKLSQSSIFIATQKAAVYQGYGNINPTNTEALKKQEYAAKQWEAMETVIAQQEKMIDMEVTQLENQLKQVQARKESTKKLVEENTKDAFTIGGR